MESAGHGDFDFGDAACEEVVEGVADAEEELRGLEAGGIFCAGDEPTPPLHPDTRVLVLRLAPPLVLTDAQIDAFVAALPAALDAALQESDS